MQNLFKYYHQFKKFDEVRTFMENNPIDMVIYFLDTGIDYQKRDTPLSIYINYIKED